MLDAHSETAHFDLQISKHRLTDVSILKYAGTHTHTHTEESIPIHVCYPDKARLIILCPLTFLHREELPY